MHCWDYLFAVPKETTTLMVVALGVLIQAGAQPLDTWTLSHFESDITLRCITYGNGLYVAAGSIDSGSDHVSSLIMVSQDGFAWDRVGQSLAGIEWQGVAYGQNTFVVVGTQRTILVAPSTNATSWTSVRSELELYDDLNAVAYGGGLFVAGGYHSALGPQQALLVTSPDGITWTPHLLDPEYGYLTTALAYGNGAFLALTDHSMLSSTNALDWTDVGLTGVYDMLRAAAFGPDQAFAVGGFGGGMFAPPTRVVFRSATGADWFNTVDVSGTPLMGLAYGDGFYASVDGAGGIFAHEEGSCWKETRFTAPAGLFAVAFGNHRFVAVGNGGTIVVSDAINPGIPRVRFPSCAPWLVKEAGGTIRIPVWRTGDPAPPASAHLISVDGSASAWSDYVPIQTTLTFAPGETNKEVTVQILDDDRPEGTGTFTLQLEPLNSNTTGLGETDTATIQILDDDDAYLEYWAPTAPSPFAPELTGLAWNGSCYVAVGIKADANNVYSQQILRSTDGHQWQDVSPSPGELGVLRAITAGEGTFVAVGGTSDPLTGSWGGQILVSQDGYSWQEVHWVPQGDLETVCYANGLFIVGGSSYGPGADGPVLLASKDALSWWSPALPAVGPGAIHSAAGGDGTFLVAGGTYSSTWTWTNYFFRSLDGTNWTFHPSNFKPVLPRLTYGNGLFLLVGEDRDITATLLDTSPDGLSWTRQLVRTHLTLGYGDFDAGFVADHFIVTGTEITNDIVRTVVLTSADGTHWTEAIAPWQAPAALTYGGGQYLVAGLGIWSSPDFVSWTPRVPDNLDLLDIAFAQDRFVAVGPTILTSTDARTWTSLPNYLPSPLSGVAFGANIFVAVGQDGTVMTSGDGLHWTNPIPRPDSSFRAISYGNGRFLAIGTTVESRWELTNNAYVSTDGSHWELAFTEKNGNDLWVDVAWGNGRFVAVGWNTIWSSADGLSWVAHDGYYGGLRAVAWGAGRFVAVGGAYYTAKYTTCYAVIASSADGFTWTRSSLPEPWASIRNGLYHGQPLSGIVYDGNSFIAVGTGPYFIGDVILSSPYGTNWTLRWEQDGRGLNSIAAGNGRLVAVGQGGRIVRPGAALGIEPALAPATPRFTLTLANEIGLRHTLLASTNLLDWGALQSFTNTTFKTLLQDPQAGLHPVRYYRSKED